MAARRPHSPDSSSAEAGTVARAAAVVRNLVYIAIILAALAAGFYVGLTLREGQRVQSAVLTLPQRETASRDGMDLPPVNRPVPSPVVEGRDADGRNAPMLETQSGTEGAPQAWYRSQPPPPSLITIPDEPIYPDPDAEVTVARRAYEEALPDDIYASPLPDSAPVAAEPPPSLKTPAPSAPTAPRRLEPRVMPGPRPDELPTWQRLALAMPDPRGRPMVAVVIDDLGLDRKRTDHAVRLPGPLTLSFLAYAEDLDRQTAAARAAGHELLLHVGMEPTGADVDPGPKVLRVGDTPGEIRRRLAWGLNRFRGFVGINNHMGSRFTADREGMRVIMDELRARGLLFLDSRTTPRSVARAVAGEFGVPMAVRNIFLDNVNHVQAVLARLAQTEALAREQGHVIAIGHPRDATLTALSQWLPSIKEKGLVLAPLSAIVRKRLRREAG